MLDITFINVGYGESILIELDEPKFVMLIDGGSGEPEEYTGDSGRIRAVDYLAEKGIDHIDLLVFSHVHEDHTCGLIPVLNEIPVDSYWTSILLNPMYFGKFAETDAPLSEAEQKALDSINTYSILMQDLPKYDITWLDGIMPDFFTTGDLTIDVLGPEPEHKARVETTMGQVFTARSAAALQRALSETTNNLNNASLILRLRYHDQAILLCGDTNRDGFEHILREAPELLKANVFKLGHHGQADSVSERLIRAIDPSVVVCCASNDYRNHSSSPETFNTIRSGLSHETEILCQDGNYNGEWCKDTAPRRALILHIDRDGIREEIEKI